MTTKNSVKYEDRSVVIIDLPLSKKVKLIAPEQVMLRVNGHVHDVGSLCYLLRSPEMRKQKKARGVVLSSLSMERKDHIRHVIEVLSDLIIEGGWRPSTIDDHLTRFKLLIDWADANEYPDILNSEEATRNAFRVYIEDIEDRFRRHIIGGNTAGSLQNKTLNLLEVITGMTDLSKGIRFIRSKKAHGGGTVPALDGQFAHALALNNAIFNGLSELVLDNREFPYKLSMPKSLDWTDDYLWVFPTNIWSLPPDRRGEARENLKRANWVYNYEQGRLATVDEIWPRYKGRDSQRRSYAENSISKAESSLRLANVNPHHHHRRILAMAAHNAFFFLFLANTGANNSVARDIETDGDIEVSSANPGFRSIKWRANAKTVSLVVPVAFIPSLRRFMELRKFLLRDKYLPYLFMSFGAGERNQMNQISEQILHSHYQTLRRIDSRLPRLGARKIRSTVSSYYKSRHDVEVEALVLQHKAETAQANYDAGTVADHYSEISDFLGKVAQKARQKIIAVNTQIDQVEPLEEGGFCSSYGEPEALTGEPNVTPDCKTGCLFCSKRVLIAGEDDARKIASAAFLMEQMISGPISEAEFRPRIIKCDEDLLTIRAFEGCAEMVDRVKDDVYGNGNLTPYFSDKFQLFLSLGVL